jgi:hypothetical protein
MMLNFNRANLSEQSINQQINELIERAGPTSENRRQYLGASAIGAGCLRKVQFDWFCDPVHPARIKDIFARGHFFEEVTRQHLIAGIQVCVGAARISNRRWSVPWPRRRNHHSGTEIVGADLSVHLGAQRSTPRKSGFIKLI